MTTPPPPPPGSAPEAAARVLIDAAFAAAGWVVQDRGDMNLTASRGVAVREFKLKQGHGYADYLTFRARSGSAAQRRLGVEQDRAEPQHSAHRAARIGRTARGVSFAQALIVDPKMGSSTNHTDFVPTQAAAPGMSRHPESCSAKFRRQMSPQDSWGGTEGSGRIGCIRP